MSRRKILAFGLMLVLGICAQLAGGADSSDLLVVHRIREEAMEHSQVMEHHSNMDVYDRVQAPDLMQAAAIIASFVYHTANRPELLPRKPLPKP